MFLASCCHHTIHLTNSLQQQFISANILKNAGTTFFTAQQTFVGLSHSFNGPLQYMLIQPSSDKRVQCSASSKNVMKQPFLNEDSH